MGGANSLVSDIQRGFDLPNDVVLRSLGLDIKSLLKKIRMARKSAHVGRLLGEGEPRSLEANRCIKTTGSLLIGAKSLV